MQIPSKSIGVSEKPNQFGDGATVDGGGGMLRRDLAMSPRQQKISNLPALGGRGGCLLAWWGPHAVGSLSHAVELVAAVDVYRLSLLLLEHQRPER